MADEIISFLPENDKAFQRGLDRLGKTVDDFRIPFNLIGNHWYRGNRKLFKLKSEGLYPPYGGFNFGERIPFKGGLSTRREVAEVLKSEEVGFIFPMLKRKGALEKSLSGKNQPFALFSIGKQELIMGTDVPYAIYHQSDRPRKKIPQRKMIFIDGGPAEVAKDAVISGRLQAWLNIMNDHITQVLNEAV